MQVVVVDGGLGGELQVIRRLRGAGLENALVGLSLQRDDAPASCAPAMADERPGARALLFQELERAEPAAQALCAVRSDGWFQGVPAIVALPLEHLEWLDALNRGANCSSRPGGTTITVATARWTCIFGVSGRSWAICC